MRTAICIFFFSFLMMAIQLFAVDGLSPEEIFTKASNEIDKENYNEALVLLNALIADKHIAPEIFFQIGNAQYKKNNIGESILGYKRALLLNPQFKEARQNLNTLRKTNEFDEFENTKIQIIAKKIPANYMSFALGFSLWLIGLGVLFAIIDKTKYSRQSLIITSFGVIFLALTVMASIQRDVSKPNINLNVVTSINSTLKNSPSDTSSNIYQLNIGSSVKLISERSEWVYVESPNELRGWMRKGNITTLWPFDYKLIN